MGAVAADPVVQSLGAAALFLLLAAAGRGQLRARLDPDTVDQRQALGDAAAALAKVGRTTAVSRIVRRTAKRGCGTPVTLLARGRRRGGSLGPRRPRRRHAAPRSCVRDRPPARDGGRNAPGPSAGRGFHALLDDDRRWVVDSGADAIVPVPGPGAELLGVLVDIPFLGALGASAGLALARVLATPMDAAASDAGEDDYRVEPIVIEAGETTGNHHADGDRRRPAGRRHRHQPGGDAGALPARASRWVRSSPCSTPSPRRASPSWP